jgi:MoxR-like ATPase
VQAIPALQTLAMLRGRDFVSSADVEYLAVPLFAHRLELSPGVVGVERVIDDAVRQPLEALSRITLR